ncbi:hypothetical protein TVAG_296130 [Trichomonas vaginalis G3]|uniref:Baseplate structural protein Gp10 C-terminal domain-containing protein n=1 Tax=Trichomonas vaginalis (strain ATCC PRA-98 / G3) TaxID=412133 RepID=A2F762_TRIV3|nr:keratin-associated protein family [Trichomonas vaginalis G3]EAX99229.1 hypothetical protein TVAG_296130 [Trichomonas vaginalis G3]KAI5547954.1 keratin-associated protein family [Trichomonas vaginalis G3]|eukprot:XP_001312159.1 hypothetical protein [Trichomonas vaginalis G3]
MNPMTDEFLFQDSKNHTVCVNPTKGTLNEKPIKELLLKADVDNKADKEYVIEKVQEEHDRADATYATKEHTHPELADKTYVDNKMSSEVTRAENEYSKKTHIHTIANITNLQETLNRKSDVGHTHTIANITNLQETLNRKSDVGHTHTIANITNLQETLNRKSDVGHTHSISEITDLNVSLEKKADKTYVNSELEEKVDRGCVASALVKKADKEYVDEKDEEIKKMVEWYHERTSKILKTKADTGWVSGCLDLKADKNHTHTSFTTVRADDIILNFDLGSSAPLENPSTSVKDTLNILDKSCRNIEDHARNFEAYELPTMLDKKADKTELQTLKTEILQTLYPIGSIYTSMNSTRPATVLGFGEWKQIVDKFLYCARYSKTAGGSKKITEANLPPHTHTGTTNFSGDHIHSLRDHPLYNSEYYAGYDVLSPDYNHSAKKTFRQTEPGGNHQHTFTTNPTGLGKDYMPPFITLFAWYRYA